MDVIIASYHESWNSREKYCKVFDATSYIIIQADPNGKIIFANKVFSFLGFDVFDLIGQDSKDLCEDTLSNTSRAHISIRRVCPRGTTDPEYFTESELAVHSIRYLSFDELCDDRNRDMERAAGICHENRKVGEVFRY